MQRCYSLSEVEPLLVRAGFGPVEAFEPCRHPETDGPMARGRVFVLAHAPVD